MKNKNWFTVFIFFVFFFVGTNLALAHQSGCHRWHSCPSDTGSYVCGDLGYTSGCGGYSGNSYSESYSTYDSSYDYSTAPTPTCPSNSYYDGISSCKCNYGYVVSGSSCVSADSICYTQLGYSSSYDSLSDTCKCSYGYVISGGQCTYGNTVCHSDHGYNSSYDDSSNKCQCDSGYTFDDNYQCVKKQNNVYFTLEEIDTSTNQAIIRSDYDYSYYLIEYGYGCYDFSIKRYLNDRIVVNLGTDYNLDFWDKIVLQNDNETCDITNVKYADSNTTLKPEEEELDYGNYYFPAQPPQAKPQVVLPSPQVNSPKKIEPTFNNKVKEIVSKSEDIQATSSEATKGTSTPALKKDSWLKLIWGRLFGRK